MIVKIKSRRSDGSLETVGEYDMSEEQIALLRSDLARFASYGEPAVGTYKYLDGENERELTIAMIYIVAIE